MLLHPASFHSNSVYGTSNLFHLYFENVFLFHNAAHKVKTNRQLCDWLRPVWFKIAFDYITWLHHIDVTICNLYLVV